MMILYFAEDEPSSFVDDSLVNPGSCCLCFFEINTSMCIVLSIIKHVKFLHCDNVRVALISFYGLTVNFTSHNARARACVCVKISSRKHSSLPNPGSVYFSHKYVTKLIQRVKMCRKNLAIYA